MMKIINFYIENKLAPFNFTIGWDTKKGKKHMELPYNWVKVTHLNYKEHLLKKTIKSKNENVINLQNCVGLRMGMKTDDGFVIIAIDLDNKDDDDENEVYNGVNKFLELISEHENINKINKLKTWIQKTGNNGYHLLFKVTEEQYNQIKNINGLRIDGKKYTIDIKADENSFIVVEPSTYFDNKNNEKTYKWLNKKGDIGLIPNWLFNLIKNKEKIKEKKVKVEKIDNGVSNNKVEVIDNKIELSDNKVEVTDEDNELEKIKPLFKFLKKKWVDITNEWFRLACLIKSLYDEEGLSLLLELSRESKLYENDEWIINEYNRIKKKSYTINSFYSFLKMDNPVEYQKLLRERKIEKKLNDTIDIIEEYLLDLEDEKLEKETIINNSIKELIEGNKIKSLNIKSPYNTAKTQLIKRIIKKYKFKRILWVTYRQSLTNDTKGNFKELGFKSYLDGVYTANRQIIQLESLLKLGEELQFDEDIEIPTFDLVILDEIEGLLSHITNDITFKGMNKEIFEYLEHIIECSNKLITLDGDMGNRTYNFINKFGPSVNIVNNVKKNKKIFKFIENKEEYKKLIFNELNENHKIVIVSQSKQEIEALQIEIKKAYPNLSILIYTSMTSDKSKMELEDVNKIWVKCDVLLYSPTIEAGVNFDTLHFNKIFGIIKPKTTCQRAFMQMLSRVRKTTNDEIYILNEDFKLNDIKEYFSFYDAFEASKNMKQFTLNRTYDMNKKTYKMTYNNYLTNYLYNIVEEKNKDTYFFLSKLTEMMVNKGHEVHFIQNDKNEKVDKQETEKVENEFFMKIANAELIRYDNYIHLLELKNANKASEQDKILIAKKYFCNCLGVKELTYDDVKFWYYNLYKIQNYNALLDIKNFEKKNEIKNELEYEKINLVKSMIDNLGLNVNDNTKYITNETLMKNFKEVFKTNKIYTCQKSSKMFFNTNHFKLDEKTTSKAILGNINKILSEYSIKISQKRLRINGIRENVYYIEILNDVDEIVKRTHGKIE